MRCTRMKIQGGSSNFAKVHGGVNAFGAKSQGGTPFWVFIIFIDKFFEISHRGSMSANPITPLTPPLVCIYDEALKMKLSSVTISKKLKKEKNETFQKRSTLIGRSLWLTKSTVAGKNVFCFLFLNEKFLFDALIFIAVDNFIKFPTKS